jgi:hypothetical protein
MWEMGGGCPRHDPDNYEPSPYIIVPDKDAHEAADTLERQATEIERLLTANDSLRMEITALLHIADRDEAEIERLREENGRLNSYNKELLYDNEQKFAELQRLQEAVKVQANAAKMIDSSWAKEINYHRERKNDYDIAIATLDSEREANKLLTAENERLRANLYQEEAATEALEEQVLGLQHIADRDEAEIERLRGMLLEYQEERRIRVIKKFLEGK